MRDEKEERKKQARSNKQTRQSNTAHPRQSLMHHKHLASWEFTFLDFHVHTCIQYYCVIKYVLSRVYMCMCTYTKLIYIHAYICIPPAYMYMYMRTLYTCMCYNIIYTYPTYMYIYTRICTCTCMFSSL